MCFILFFFHAYNKRHLHTHYTQMTLQESIEQERLSYINVRGRLLQFFLVNSFNNDTEEFSKHNIFPNDMKRMKYFIDIFDELYHENEVIQCDLVFANGMWFITDYNTPFEVIQSIKNSIKTIKEHLGLAWWYIPLSFFYCPCLLLSNRLNPSRCFMIISNRSSFFFL